LPYEVEKHGQEKPSSDLLGIMACSKCTNELHTLLSAVAD